MSGRQWLGFGWCWIGRDQLRGCFSDLDSSPSDCGAGLWDRSLDVGVELAERGLYICEGGYLSGFREIATNGPSQPQMLILHQGFQLDFYRRSANFRRKELIIGNSTVVFA